MLPNVPVYYEELDNSIVTNNYIENIKDCFSHMEHHKKQSLVIEGLIDISNKLQLMLLNRVENHIYQQRWK